MHRQNMRAATLVAAAMLSAVPSLARAQGQAASPPAADAPAVAQPPPGSSRTAGWAVVAANGALDRFKNVAANIHTGIGAYRITFKDKVDRCRYVATMTDDFGFVRVLRYKSDQRALVVETANTSGAPADRSFYLQVIC